MDVGEMQPGKRYLVELDDCCVEGHFTDVFVRYEPPLEAGEDPRTSISDAVFERGKIGPLWGKWKVTEIQG